MTYLSIGSRVDAPGGSVELLASKFNRHTFWCGQSGSGKTYALGVLLEQLLLHTELPLLVLDPNADFVHLNEPRPEADPAEGSGIGGTDMRILHSGPGSGNRVRTRFTDLSVASKAAVLQLDPVRDAGEFNVLLNYDTGADGATFDGSTFDGANYIASLRSSGNPGQAQLATRIENLQVLDWDLWSRGGESVTDIIDTRPRATVMELGGFSDPAEPKVAALAVLEHLWATRAERRPVLIVIDEAHNLCSPNPATPVERALTEQLIQIAAEGRKFGLWLFLSTQRPGKIHPNVLSQCDNLGLMRINSPRDLEELAGVFGYVPRELVNRSKDFVQGQGLFAGGFIEQATLAQMRNRVTLEGGSDVKVPLRGGR